MVEDAPSPDREVLRQKIEFLQSSLRLLRSIREEGEEHFLSEEVSQAAATRSLQVGVEAILDTRLGDFEVFIEAMVRRYFQAD